MTNDNTKRAFWTATDWESWPERQRARTINSLSGFKSATLIGTANAKGQNNLSIVSSVIHLGSFPALMGMVLRPPGEDSHTYKNISATGQYTMSHVTADMVPKAHQCSARYPADVSEFDAVGLTPWRPASINDWLPPGVAEALIRMGLTLEKDMPLPNGCRFIIGRVKWAEVPQAAISSDGYVSLEHAQGVAISGLDGYHRTAALGRLSYAKVDQLPHQQKDMLKGWED